MALATLTIDINARLASIEKDMGRAAQIAERNAKRMEDAFKGVEATLGALGGVLSVGLFAGWVKQAVDAADALDQLAERTGVSVETLNGLSYAVKLSGGDMEALEKGLQSLNKQLSLFQAGDKSTTALFNALGISATDAEGALLQLADVFPRLEKTDQVRAGTELLGKAYASLVPLLAQGRAGLQGMIEEGQNLNPITAESAKQAAEFNDNLDRLRRLSDSAAMQIGNALIPSLNRLADEFLDARKAGLSFMEAIAGIGGSDPSKSAEQQIARITGELNKLRNGKWYEKSLVQTIGGDELAAQLEKELAYWKIRAGKSQAEQNRAALAGFDDNPMGYSATPKIKLPSLAGEPRAAKAARTAAVKEYEPLAEAAKTYSKAMEELVKAQALAETSGLDLTSTQKRLMETMMSPEWLQMPEAWRVQVAAQGEAAFAAEKFAATQARLRELLTDTGLEKQRDDMLLLTKALEEGQISAEKYTEAVQRALGNVDLKPIKDEFADLKQAIEGWGKDAAAAMVDFAVVGKSSFGDMVDSILSDIARMLVYKNITGPIASAVSGFDFASFFGFADGGVMSSRGPLPLRAYASGGIASTPQLAMFGEGSRPEAYVPLPDGRTIPVTMKGAGTVVQVNVQNNAGTVAQASATASTDSAGNTQINVMIERIEGMMGRRIQQGGGLAPMLEGRYGLNPAAGARW